MNRPKISGSRPRPTSLPVPAISKRPARRRTARDRAPLAFTRLSPPKPTRVYDTYWRFADERQRIYFQRLAGMPGPWTSDSIFAEYRFTNAYRAADRVSQYLIRSVIYQPGYSPRDTLFRILLFKSFNKIQTWQLLEQQFGEIRYDTFDLSCYAHALSTARTAGHRIYSAAYIMPSGKTTYGHGEKHRNHLALIDQMMHDRLTERIQSATSMASLFELLLAYPMIGPFLAYQLTIDINYSELTDFDEMDFVVPGPGALDGIRKCFSDLGDLKHPDVIRLVADQQQTEFERLELPFQSLWGRPLQLIDCQNLFCEVDKYARVKHPEVSSLSGRTRIKQRFEVQGPIGAPWFPPKWQLPHEASCPHHETN